MDGGAWPATVPGVAKSQTRLNDFHFTSVDGSLGCFHTLAIVNNAAVNLGAKN